MAAAVIASLLSPVATPVLACDFGFWSILGEEREFHQLDFKAFETTLAVEEQLVFDDPMIRRLWVDDTTLVSVEALDDGSHRLAALRPGKAIVRVFHRDRPSRVPEAREHPKRAVVTLVVRIEQPENS